MCDFDQLTTLVRRCVRGSLSEFERAHPDDMVAGCALFTDDDLSGLFPMLCSRTDSENGGDAYLFQPIDWDYEADSQSDREVCELMARWSSRAGDSFDEYVRKAHAALVSGVSSLRSEGILATDVFVTVGSTDPGDLMERLERETILSHNSRSIVRRWLEFGIRESRAWMEDLRQKEQPLSFADQDTIHRLGIEQKNLSVMLENLSQKTER